MWRVDFFFKISKRNFTFIRKMRVLLVTLRYVANPEPKNMLYNCIDTVQYVFKVVTYVLERSW